MRRCGGGAVVGGPARPRAGCHSQAREGVEVRLCATSPPSPDPRPSFDSAAHPIHAPRSAVVIGVAAGAMLQAVRGAVFGVLALEPKVAAVAGPYWVIRALMIPLAMVNLAASGVLQAMGVGVGAWGTWAQAGAVVRVLGALAVPLESSLPPSTHLPGLWQADG